MKRLLGFLAASMLLFAGACGVPVRSDEVGVLVREMGSQAGVDPNELSTGRHWPGVGEYIIKFPKRTVTEVWATVDPQEGDTSISGGPPLSFANSDGVQTGIAMSLQIRIDPDKASDLVQKYRLGLEEIVDGPVRRRIQGALARRGISFTSEQLISGGGATQLLGQVLAEVAPVLAAEGIIVESIEQIGSASLPRSIRERINQAVEARQTAETRNQQLAITQAESAQRIEEARGRAEALAIEGRAIRENPEVLKLREIEKSLGICPMGAQVCVVGGSASTNVGAR